MPTHKRRNVETYGRKPRGNPPIRRTGSRLWDRRIHFLITRALAFGRQSRSVATAVAVFGIAGSSSKSSWIAGEWIFVLVIPRPWTTFYRSPAGMFRTNSACGLCAEAIVPDCVSTRRPPDFLPLDQPSRRTVALASRQKPHDRPRAIVMANTFRTGRRLQDRSEDRSEPT